MYAVIVTVMYIPEAETPMDLLPNSVQVKAILFLIVTPGTIPMTDGIHLIKAAKKHRIYLTNTVLYGITEILMYLQENMILIKEKSWMKTYCWST